MKNNFHILFIYNTFRTFRKLIKHEAKAISDHFHFHLSLSVKIPADVKGVGQTVLFLVHFSVWNSISFSNVIVVNAICLVSFSLLSPIPRDL